MRIRDRLASAAASFVEGAALMDIYAASALYGTAERRPAGDPAPGRTPHPLRAEAARPAAAPAPPGSDRAGSRYRTGAAQQGRGAVGAR